MGYFYSFTPKPTGQIKGGGNMYLIHDALLAAGWTIHRWVTNTRLHASYGSEHIEIATFDTYKLRAYYCTGYDSGAGIGAQPGSSGAIYFAWNLSDAGDYLTVQIQDSQIFLAGRGNSGGWAQSLIFCVITQKIGSWNGGRLIAGDNQTANLPLGSAPQSSQLFLEGAWVTGLYGTQGNAPLLYSRPLSHNGASVLTPIMVCKNNTEFPTFRQPIGYINNVYQAAPTNFYEDGETILVGEDTYRWVLCNGSYWLLLKAA